MSETKNISKIIATVGKKVAGLPIKNGQMIFVQDRNRIALDFNDKRVFYNEINVLKTEEERQSLATPIEGCFYFIIETAILWYYEDNTWTASTSTPGEVIFIGASLPSLGTKSKLYVDKTNKNISIWDEEQGKYEVVAEKIHTIDKDEIYKMFNH